MIRKIIHIDEETCNGCGLCAAACHEGAIGMENGKAKLLRDDYCDGLGDCLPVCPTVAITFVEREAAAYDEAAVQARMKKSEPLPCGCPGSNARVLRREAPADVSDRQEAPVESALMQWPVQMKLVPAKAPYFDGADLLVSADCAAFAYGDFHRTFMENKVTVIGCPKLDEGDYSQKLTAILSENNIRSVTVVRMEVPCCGGIERAVQTAVHNCGLEIPMQTVTILTDGQILK